MTKEKQKSIAVFLGEDSAVYSHGGGGQEKVNVIDILPPTKKALRKSWGLRQILMQAMLQVQKTFSAMQEDTPKEEEDDSGILDKKSVLTILMSANIDMETCFSHFEKLAIAGCVEVNGKAIRADQLQQVDEESLEEALLVFLGNFIWPIVMKALSDT